MTTTRIPHDGSACPVSPGTKVRIHMRAGSEGVCIERGILRWSHQNVSTDIIAYEILDRNSPREYDLSDPAELKRLMRETWGYLRTCQTTKCGGDFEGRAFAMEALRTLADAPDTAAILESDWAVEGPKLVRELAMIADESGDPDNISKRELAARTNGWRSTASCRPNYPQPWRR